MKTLVIFAVLLMATSGYSFTSAPKRSNDQSVSVRTSSQTNDFSYFRAHRQGKSGVALSWGVTSMNDVAGFLVERSEDLGDNFFVINQIPCNGALKQDCKDQDVFPGYIYYRIGCVMSDGSIHYTPVEIVRIVQHG